MFSKLKYSLTFRIAFMFTLSAFTVLFLLGFAVLYTINQHFISQDRMMLEAQSQHITHELHTVDNINQVPTLLAKIVTNNAHSEHGFILLVTNTSGNILFNSAPDQQDFATLAAQSITTDHGLSTLQQDNNSYRLLSQSMNIAEQKVTIIIALNINHHQTFLVAFKHSMWLSIAIAALIMGLLACLVARKGLSPLHTLMAQTAKITVNNLAQPLPVNNSYLEISQLTTTFNAMLDRLNHSFQRLIDFSSDLAHELRTPLSTMKMQNQVILSRPRSINDYQQALQDNELALDQMTKMVTDMLFLAKSDNGLISPEVTPFNLHNEIRSLLDFYDYLAQEKGMELHLSGQGIVNGDKNLLRRAFSNLITNAINYGDQHSIIVINIAEQSQNIHITITNQGDTIEPKHLPHLFERFYRVDSARTHSPDGAGLGLAITSSIIIAHQGQIKVTSQNQQTCFTVTFKQSRAS